MEPTERYGAAEGGTGGSTDELKGKAKSTAREAKQEAKEKGRELRDEVKERAVEAKHRVEEEVEQRSSDAAGRLRTVKDALDSAARTLDERNEAWLADRVRRASSQMDRMGDYLEDEDTPGMVRDLERTARENPGTFMGSAFAAGLAVGRFLRSSSRSGDGSEAQSGTGSRSDYSGDGASATPSRRWSGSSSTAGAASSAGSRATAGGRDTGGSRDTAGSRDTVGTPSPEGNARTGGAGMASAAAGGRPAEPGLSDRPRPSEQSTEDRTDRIDRTDRTDRPEREGGR